ncbi:unnamed protein product [Rotaria socialis]|uniref:G domain-containing protein n=2 Tax=Rotaria socialis TaxID=392032 RepID=A0A817N406_9BILA|nr:unnamed protein product [Rotaria socialis]CAF3550418.1 unnamed protein product [Rotaria socialis]CAF3561547.1 unnamed protein product [Rotaria socialis]CAF3599819.1 unnamed protein product [Rotaria socialis]CAF3681046.1 unnamed protein product [Rotaria socialis]
MSASNYDGKSKFTCKCGRQYDNEIALDQHKATSCENQDLSCPLCEESLSSSIDMRIHLFRCGAKTEKCPVCQKYIHRAIYNFHVENNCIDLDEDEPNGSNVNTEYDPLNRTDRTQIESRNEPSDNITPFFERLELNFNEELVNTTPQQAMHNRVNAVSYLHGKASQIQESLSREYYPIEVNHVAEKLEFNIILIGSPRVGKSEFINAICNGEKKAETSPSLNSCTKEVTCYFLEDNQERMPGIKPFRINFYDTPGIESWTKQDGKATMLKFIEDKDPICVIYCAAPGSFADLPQVRPVLEFCQKKNIFWAFVCTNMWSSVHRKEVIEEFEKELAIFGVGIEKSFDQSHSPIPHKVTVFGRSALCTMVNSIEYYDPEYSPERKTVQGIDELIHCIMEALDDEKLLGWCNAVLYRRSFWEKLGQNLNGFFSIRIKDIQNMHHESTESMTSVIMKYIYSIVRKR